MSINCVRMGLRRRGAVVRRVAGGLIGAAALLALLTPPGSASASTAADTASGAGAELFPVACRCQPRDLPGLPGGRYAGVLGADRSGHYFAGYAFQSDTEEHAVLWRDGRLVDIGRPAGSYSQANGVNRNGVVIGSSSDPTRNFTWFGFVYRNGAATMLAVPPGYAWVTPNSINDAGLIIGGGQDATGAMHALMWRADRPDLVQDLGTGLGNLGLGSLTEDGTAVGGTYRYVGDFAAPPVVWNARTGLRQLPVPAGGREAGASAIAGDYIVGVQGITDGDLQTRALLWNRERLQPIQQVRQGTGAGAIDINARGTIIGYGVLTDGTGNQFSVVWPTPASAPQSLPLPPGRDGAVAATITDTGLIAGITSAGFRSFATIWTCRF